MAKAMNSVSKTRIDPDLRDEFMRAAQSNAQTTSEAMRDAIRLYIKRAKEQRFREQAERISANVEQETEIMTWIAEHSAPLDSDD
jgi:metal-responsive CopG/Arc/MetJ family transcriptional regulator